MAFNLSNKSVWTSGQTNLTKGYIAATHGQFNGIRQVAPVWPSLNICFPGPIQVQIANGISIGSAVFAQLTAVSPYTLQWTTLSPPQNCPFPWGIWPPSNTGFLGPIQAHNPNGISIGSAVFAPHYCERQTDRPRYLVCNDRPLRCTAMWPKNVTALLVKCRSLSSDLKMAFKTADCAVRQKFNLR